MPRASANMSAKFIAQIETSKPRVSSASRPAEATSPRIVSISGSPAATSDPKAKTRMIIVTGHENSSDFIIAVRLAVLKSLHIPEAPVNETVVPFVPSARSLPFSESAAATIAVGSPLAPAVMIAVCRSCEIDAPGCGADTDATRRSVRSVRSAAAIVERKPALSTACVCEWTTTISAELDRPAKLRWISCRACTDWEPFACQPAPDSADSTFGAKKPNPTAITIHAIATARP